jgi:hypothetical protein
MEVLPRHLPVAMGERRRNRRYESPPLRPINTLTQTHSELLVFGLLLANILQSSIAIRSPPAPYPPVPSPAKALSPPRQPSTTANWRSLGNKSAGLSPKVRLALLPLITAHMDPHTSRRPRSASCLSPRPRPWVARARAQAARRTHAVSHSPTPSHSPISSRRHRRPHHHRPQPHSTARSAHSHPHPRQCRH